MEAGIEKLVGTENSPAPRLGRSQVIRLSRLLNMYYRPKEIAEILGVHPETVRRTYLAAGCPHRRDANGHIWIIGTAFKEWAEDVIAKRKRRETQPMQEDEAWCFKCKGRVKLINPKALGVNRYLEILQSSCPSCGTKVNRAQARQSE